MEELDPVEERKIPYAFILRRFHSLCGLWLVLYLCEHLVVNAQLAFFSHASTSTFVRMVNMLHAIPYLKVIEAIFLALPFVIHGLWGLQYAYTSRINSIRSSGKTPSLPYPTNRALGSRPGGAGGP